MDGQAAWIPKWREKLDLKLECLTLALRIAHIWKKISGWAVAYHLRNLITFFSITDSHFAFVLTSSVGDKNKWIILEFTILSGAFFGRVTVFPQICKVGTPPEIAFTVQYVELMLGCSACRLFLKDVRQVEISWNPTCHVRQRIRNASWLLRNDDWMYDRSLTSLLGSAPQRSTATSKAKLSHKSCPKNHGFSKLVVRRSKRSLQ